MTHFKNQSDLEHLSITELRWMLRDIFNALAGMKKNSPECAEALASAEEIQKVLRRKMYGPKRDSLNSAPTWQQFGQQSKNG